MGFYLDTQATRSTLMSVDSTLSENITAAQNYIPIASTTNFSTGVVAEIETTNEVVSFTDISQNNLQYSQTFDNAYWQKLRGTVSADATTAPDGTTTADQLTQASGQTSNGLVQVAAGVSVVNTVTYVLSIFAKKGTNRNFTWIKETVSRGGGGITQWFDLDNGTLGTLAPGGSASLANLSAEADGWYRCSVTFTADATRAGQVSCGVCESDASTSNTDDEGFIYIWGFQWEADATLSTYLPTTTAALVGLTDVTRGVNGTTATLATSGDAIQQLPYALSAVNMPTRLRGISVSSDGTGAGRFTLCDNVGTTLCDIDIPDTRIYDLSFGGGIIFPNGIYVSNSDNITGYTLYTDKHSGAAL